MSAVSAVISGTGMSVPERVLTNAELEAMVDTSDEWIVTRTGIRERRIAGDGDSLASYCVLASRRALDAAGVAPTDVDLIVLATVTPDMPIPATACTIQHELGCTSAAAFDLSAGCSGFIYAQSVAKQFIVTGRCRHVLVIGAELLSQFLDWHDRSTCVIFADGAGATVLSGRSAAARRPRVIDALRRQHGRLHLHARWGSAASAEPARDARPAPALHPHARQRDVQDRRALDRRGVSRGARRRGPRPGRRRLVRPAPGEPAHHRRRSERGSAFPPSAAS